MMQPSPSDQPQLVLIVTNSAYDLATLRPMLSGHGLRAEVVGRGDEALALAAQGGVALALLDAALAGSARLELCQRLKQICGDGLPVFLLSGMPDSEEREQAAEAGAAAYLPLSFPADDMAEKSCCNWAGSSRRRSSATRRPWPRWRSTTTTCWPARPTPSC